MTKSENRTKGCRVEGKRAPTNHPSLPDSHKSHFSWTFPEMLYVQTLIFFLLTQTRSSILVLQI